MSIVLAILLLSPHLAGVAEDDPALRGFMNEHCVDCHEGVRARSDLDLTVVMDRIEAGETPASLERILERLRRRDMPPEDEPRPDEAAYEEAIGALDALVAAAADRPPARNTVRRLGRHEYANTIRDLVGLELRIEQELPADEIADGFDNNGDALSVPPLLLEKYFDLAESIASAVVVPPDVVFRPDDAVDPGAGQAT